MKMSSKKQSINGKSRASLSSLFSLTQSAPSNEAQTKRQPKQAFPSIYELKSSFETVQSQNSLFRYKEPFSKSSLSNSDSTSTSIGQWESVESWKSTKDVEKEKILIEK